MGGTPPDPDSHEGRVRVAKDQQAVTEFQSAHGALLGAGMIAELMVRRACEHDQPPEGHEQLEALKRGLSWLANYWGLTNGEKRNVK